MTDEANVSRRGLVLNATAAAVAAGTLGTPHPASAQAVLPAHWTHEADVVVIGSGATGYTAAIVAREAGATVIVVEAENHIGGHAITSGGNVPLGGGTSVQKKHGIEDSPDLLFHDLTDWSVVEPNGFPDYRYNDREIIRAFADHSVATFECTTYSRYQEGDHTILLGRVEKHRRTETPPLLLHMGQMGSLWELAQSMAKPT